MVDLTLVKTWMSADQFKILKKSSIFAFFTILLLDVIARFLFIPSQPLDLVSLQQQIKSDGINCPWGKLVDFLDQQVCSFLKVYISYFIN